jgi:Type IV leader peptidase family
MPYLAINTPGWLLTSCLAAPTGFMVGGIAARGSGWLLDALERKWSPDEQVPVIATSAVHSTLRSASRDRDESFWIAPGLSDTSVIRIVVALLAVLVVFRFHISWHGLAVFSFCVSLIALGVMDFRARVLPDLLTLPLLAAGIGISATSSGFTGISDSAIGVATAYLLLLLVNRMMRHRVGVDRSDMEISSCLQQSLHGSAVSRH